MPKSLFFEVFKMSPSGTLLYDYDHIICDVFLDANSADISMKVGIEARMKISRISWFEKFYFAGLKFREFRGWLIFGRFRGTLISRISRFL